MGTYTPTLYAYNFSTTEGIVSTARYTAAVYHPYATMLSAAGNGWGYADTPGQPHIYLVGGTSLGYNYLKSLYICLDLRGYNVVNFSSATFRFNVNICDYAAHLLPWEGASTYDSVVMSGMNEDVKGATFSQTTDYKEINEGFGVHGDFSDRKLFSTLNATGNFTWTMNATGLAYLNTVKNKTYNPGYAFLSMIFGGQSSGVAPTNATTSSQDVSFDFDTTTVVTLTFTAPVQINVGDTWKEVIGIQQSISNAWKYTRLMELNIGDIWKTIV
jgi:hypothetical protein